MRWPCRHLSRRSLLNEVLWSDPTDSDEKAGCHPNARGPNTVSYGPDRVRDFCEANGLKLLVRAHQCVQDGAPSRDFDATRRDATSLVT